MAAIEELKKDIAELEQLGQTATRTKVKDILSIEVRRLQTDLMKKQEKLQSESTPKSDAPKQPSKPVKYTKTITTYAWDQSEKFMKIYVTLNGVQSIPAENVKAEFTNRTAVLTVGDLEGNDHRCSIGRLHDNIIIGESYHKIKKDMVLLMLKKKTANSTWAYVTEQADKKKAPPPKEAGPEGAGAGDPNDNLMSMLKNMYEGGDDDMKRTIAEAWSKSNPMGQPQP